MDALAEAGTARTALAGSPAQTHLHQATAPSPSSGWTGSQLSEQLDRLLGELASQQRPSRRRSSSWPDAALRPSAITSTNSPAANPIRNCALFDLYTELAEAQGLETPTPGELFYPDLSLRPAFPAQTGISDDPKHLCALRGRFERGLLKWFRNGNDPAGPLEMREAVAGIESQQAVPAARAFWFAATAFFDALGQLAIPRRRRHQRFCGRIDAQMRRVMEGSGASSPNA